MQKCSTQWNIEMHPCERRGRQRMWLSHSCARGHVNRPTITSSVSSSKGIYVRKLCYAIIQSRTYSNPSLHKRPLYFLNSCIIHNLHLYSSGLNKNALSFAHKWVLQKEQIKKCMRYCIKNICCFLQCYIATRSVKSGKVDKNIIHYSSLLIRFMK